MSEARGRVENKYDIINKGYLDKNTITLVSSIPTASEGTLGCRIIYNNKQYKCLTDGSIYFWSEIANGVIVVDSNLPTDNISIEAIYNLHTIGYEYNSNIINPTFYATDGVHFTIATNVDQDQLYDNDNNTFIEDSTLLTNLSTYLTSGYLSTTTYSSAQIAILGESGSEVVVYDISNNIDEVDVYTYYNYINGKWNKLLQESDLNPIISLLNEVNTEYKKAGFTFSLVETDSNDNRSFTLTVRDKNNNVVYTKYLGAFLLNSRTIAGLNLLSNISAGDLENQLKDVLVTYTNKTIDADDNTIENLEVDNFKQSAVANGSADNDKLVTLGKLNDVKQEIIDSTFTFKGFMSSTQPSGNISSGSLWYESNTLPTAFPIQVKSWNGTEWSSITTDYTPNQFDTWAMLADAHGYYWFGNSWNILDATGGGGVTVDGISIGLNLSGQLEVKDNGITIAKLNSNLLATTISNDTNTIPKTSAIYNALDNRSSLTARVWEITYDDGTTENISVMLG